MRDRILPEFEDLLLSGSLIPAKNAPFYGRWVSKFLTFSNKNQDLGPDLRVENHHQSPPIILREHDRGDFHPDQRDFAKHTFTLLLTKNGGKEWTWSERPWATYWMRSL